MLHGGMNATAVTGSELHHLLLALLETTHSRLWITQFILDARPDFDDGRGDFQPLDSSLDGIAMT